MKSSRPCNHLSTLTREEAGEAEAEGEPVITLSGRKNRLRGSSTKNIIKTMITILQTKVTNSISLQL